MLIAHAIILRALVYLNISYEVVIIDNCSLLLLCTHIADDDGTYSALNDEGESYKLEKVSITLNDCLACSGCITSAESVLITQQSQHEVRGQAVVG